MSACESALRAIPELADVDDVIELFDVGWFHWRMLLVCGMAFMVSIIITINTPIICTRPYYVYIYSYINLVLC